VRQRQRSWSDSSLWGEVAGPCAPAGITGTATDAPPRSPPVTAAGAEVWCQSPAGVSTAVSPGRLTTIASWLLRAMTTTASSPVGFSSRCGTNGGTKT